MIGEILTEGLCKFTNHNKQENFNRSSKVYSLAFLKNRIYPVLIRQHLTSLLYALFILFAFPSPSLLFHHFYLSIPLSYLSFRIKRIR